MQALVFTAPGEVQLQTVPTPEPAEGEALVTVRASAICGSELHGFKTVGFRRPPLVMGHEFAGETEDGRRVVVNPLLACGHCDRCAAGAPQQCRSKALLGVHRAGGFAEQVAVPVSSLHELPEDMAWERAALVEPLANAVHLWSLVGPSRSDRVAVVGAGTIGLVTILVARELGLTDVTVAEPARHRRDLAARLGASQCEDELRGEFDVVVDAVGASSTRSASVEALRPGGTAAWIGLAEPDTGVDGNSLVRQERRVLGSFAYTPDDFATALGMAGGLDLDWVTPVTLEDSQRVFMELAQGASHPVKAVISP